MKTSVIWAVAVILLVCSSARAKQKIKLGQCSSCRWYGKRHEWVEPGFDLMGFLGYL